ncbi:MAG: hypothetical protein ACRCX2_04930 [Paraclostridium sp.]
MGYNEPDGGTMSLKEYFKQQESCECECTCAGKKNRQHEDECEEERCAYCNENFIQYEEETDWN